MLPAMTLGPIYVSLCPAAPGVSWFCGVSVHSWLFFSACVSELPLHCVSSLQLILFCCTEFVVATSAMISRTYCLFWLKSASNERSGCANADGSIMECWTVFTNCRSVSSSSSTVCTHVSESSLWVSMFFKYSLVCEALCSASVANYVICLLCASSVACAAFAFSCRSKICPFKFSFSRCWRSYSAETSWSYADSICTYAWEFFSIRITRSSNSLSALR